MDRKKIRYLFMLISFALVVALALRILTELIPKDVLGFAVSPLIIGVGMSFILSAGATMAWMYWDISHFNFLVYPVMWTMRWASTTVLIFTYTVINLEEDFTVALLLTFLLNLTVIYQAPFFVSKTYLKPADRKV